jgi:DNA mismatch repair protein MSH5
MRGVDTELDDLKRNYDGLDSILTEVGKNIEERVPATLHAQINIIYFPQIGFLISLCTDNNAGSESMGSEPLESWERMFTTEECTYYKSSHMREMDQKYGDLWSMICDKEIEMVHELAKSILQYEELLTTVSDICGELDSMIALALGAKQYRLCRPSLTPENIIHIKGGRHMLQELTVRSYVANDTLLVGGQGSSIDAGPDSNDSQQNLQSRDQPSDATQQTTAKAGPADSPSMLIMTGPNYSGKSVYLKQVALIVYMAHIGWYVFAVYYGPMQS